VQAILQRISYQIYLLRLVVDKAAVRVFVHEDVYVNFDQSGTVTKKLVIRTTTTAINGLNRDHITGKYNNHV
jgi:hypothetical protein